MPLFCFSFFLGLTRSLLLPLIVYWVSVLKRRTKPTAGWKVINFINNYHLVLFLLLKCVHKFHMAGFVQNLKVLLKSLNFSLKACMNFGSGRLVAAFHLAPSPHLVLKKNLSPGVKEKLKEKIKTKQKINRFGYSKLFSTFNVNS